MRVCDEPALVATVLGLPKGRLLGGEESIPTPRPPYKLSKEQRIQWYNLVQAGKPVNEALMIVRGLL